MPTDSFSTSFPSAGDSGILKVFVQRTDSEWIRGTVARIVRSKLHLRKLILVLIKFIVSERHPEWARHALIWFNHLIISHGYQIKRSPKLLRACQPLVAHSTKIAGLQSLYRAAKYRGCTLEKRSKFRLHNPTVSAHLFYDERRQITSTGYVFVDDSDEELGQKRPSVRLRQRNSGRQSEGELLSCLDSRSVEDVEDGSSWLLDSDQGLSDDEDGDDDDDYDAREGGSNSDSDLDNLDMLSPLPSRLDQSDFEGDEDAVFTDTDGGGESGAASDDGVFDVHSETTTTLVSEDSASGENESLPSTDLEATSIGLLSPNTYSPEAGVAEPESFSQESGSQASASADLSPAAKRPCTPRQKLNRGGGKKQSGTDNAQSFVSTTPRTRRAGCPSQEPIGSAEVSGRQSSRGQKGRVKVKSTIRGSL